MISRKNIIISLMVFMTLLFPGKGFAAELDLNIDSEAAVLMDAKSGQILYEKNGRKQMYPASITKIATAIYALENGNLSDEVTVTENAFQTEGTRVYLEPNEVVTLEKLLIGMLMNSGNDAAVAIAEHIDGSVSRFAESVNYFLQTKIGVMSTHFENPHGLFGKNHYTTAADMAKITQYAMGNANFRNYFGMKTYKWDGKSWDTTLLTHHRLLKGEFPYEGITGGKTGYVHESGHTLVTTATNNDLQLIVVTMNSRNQNRPYTDTIQLLDYGFEFFSTKSIDENTTLEFNSKKFTVPKELYYTVKNGEEIQQEIDANGKLSIISSTGKELVNFSLIPVDEPIKTSNSAKSANIDGGRSYTVLWISILIILLGLGTLISRSRLAR
ncbi:D-alanyl-D-alanine carboxypeptidase family protein [Bacillus kwashiorkori]|uniref:D-alanyl-D-alanine carboxypeptidase family protein n=1 Tax=Bacillus kwashiorkori TaxID=1522318 RepID=UPI0007804D83|nr:D-alanyl-D-alanine carboxypeptidase family protein [Bacillus kwashiorkori]